MTAKASAPADEHGRGFRLSLIIAVLAMLAPFSIDTYLPSFPDIARELNAADWQLQQTLSLYLLAFAAMTLVYGPLSDAFGRRRVVLTALVFYTISSIGCVFATDIHGLLLARIGQGLAASGPIVIGRAIVRDAFSGARAQKVMSQIMLLFGAAPAIAPILGGYLHDAFGWRSVFWFLTVLGLGLCVWTASMLPETLKRGGRQTAHPRAIAIAYWHALKNKGFMLLVMSTAVNFGGLFLYVAASPAVLYQHLGFGADQFGYLFVPLVSGLMFGAFISGRLAGRYTHEQAVNIGFGIMLSAAVINLAASLWLSPQIWTVAGPMMIYSAGLSISMPNLSLLALDCLPDRRGLAAAVQSFVQMVTMAIVAGVLVPPLSMHLGSLAAGTLVLAALSLWFWSSYRRRTPTPVAHGAPPA
ncbi:MAG: multidrug effflux MFS transporter [Gammaproteobacteria bacterium]|nr:multidrug effflux MFS transporter [Gammaproteobacteria bacterium]